MIRQMTTRERMRAVLSGSEHDRVPFCTYGGMEGLPFDEITAMLGPNRWGRLHYAMIHTVTYPHCGFESVDYTGNRSPSADPVHEAIGLRFAGPDHSMGERWQRNTIHTPAGALYEERVFEPNYDSSTARKHYLETAADYEVFWAFLEDAVIEPDYDRYLREDAMAGDDGMAMVWIERTPYQQLWVEWVGLGNLGIHMADFPDHVHHTMDLLTTRARKTFEIAARSPAPFIEMPDNITAPAIGPKRFREYCVPLYNELAAMLADQGALVFVHMDGELQGLWDDIAASAVGGLDSFTPAPDTATPIEQAVACCPQVRLWVNFPASLHLARPDDIRACADSILGAAGHTGRLQVQITENIAEGTWPTSLPIIADAIEEFGAP